MLWNHEEEKTDNCQLSGQGGEKIEWVQAMAMSQLDSSQSGGKSPKNCFSHRSLLLLLLKCTPENCQFHSGWWHQASTMWRPDLFCLPTDHFRQGSRHKVLFLCRFYILSISQHARTRPCSFVLIDRNSRRYGQSRWGATKQCTTLIKYFLLISAVLGPLAE